LESGGKRSSTRICGWAALAVAHLAEAEHVDARLARWSSSVSGGRMTAEARQFSLFAIKNAGRQAPRSDLARVLEDEREPQVMTVAVGASCGCSTESVRPAPPPRVTAGGPCARAAKLMAAAAALASNADEA
jgi:hypothetical protein